MRNKANLNHNQSKKSPNKPIGSSKTKVKMNQALIQSTMESKKTILELIPTKNQDKENLNKNSNSSKRPYSQEKGVKEIPESPVIVIVILDSLETQDSLVSRETPLIIEDLNLSKNIAILLLIK